MTLEKMSETIENNNRFHIVPKDAVVKGMTLIIPTWEFRCSRRNPELATTVLLPKVTFTFAQSGIEQYATIFVHPDKKQGNEMDVEANYIIRRWELGIKMPEEPAGRFLNRVGQPMEILPLVAHIIIPATGDGDEIIVKLEYTDQNWIPEVEEIQTSIGLIRRFQPNEIPEGWEKLNVRDHSAAFPLPYGFTIPGKDGDITCIQVS